MNYDVELSVQIQKVGTLVDGSPRIVFDCQEGQTKEIAILMEYQARGIVGTLRFVPDAIKVNEHNKMNSDEDEGKPKRVIEIK